MPHLLTPVPWALAVTRRVRVLCGAAVHGSNLRAHAHSVNKHAPLLRTSRSPRRHAGVTLTLTLASSLPVLRPCHPAATRHQPQGLPPQHPPPRCRRRPRLGVVREGVARHRGPHTATVVAAGNREAGWGGWGEQTLRWTNNPFAAQRELPDTPSPVASVVRSPRAAASDEGAGSTTRARPSRRARVASMWS